MLFWLSEKELEYLPECILHIHFYLRKGFKSKDSVPKLVRDYMSGKIKLDEFITHKMSLEQVNDAINLMKTGEWYIFHSLLSV